MGRHRDLDYNCSNTHRHIRRRSGGSGQRGREWGWAAHSEVILVKKSKSQRGVFKAGQGQKGVNRNCPG